MLQKGRVFPIQQLMKKKKKFVDLACFCLHQQQRVLTIFREFKNIFFNSEGKSSGFCYHRTAIPQNLCCIYQNNAINRNEKKEKKNEEKKKTKRHFIFFVILLVFTTTSDFRGKIVLFLAKMFDGTKEMDVEHEHWEHGLRMGEKE